FDTQEVVWLWGHEHRLAIYDRFSVGGGISAFGRCVGHGGMPVELGPPDTKKAPLKWYDTRSHTLDNGTPVGQNGFVNLTVEGDRLTLDYRDIGNTQLLVETFTAGPKGALQTPTQTNYGVLTSP